METIHTLTSASKEIKQTLRKIWPNVKFSVKSKSYSGGCSINVDWDMGPTSKQVEQIVNKYQYGSFDGMTDSYNYDSTLVMTQDDQIKVLGGAKYVFCNRRIPQELQERIMRDICQRQQVEYVGCWTPIYSNSRITCQDAYWQSIQDADFTKGQYQGLEDSVWGAANKPFALVIK